MDVGSYILLSHEAALKRRMDVTANNMANLSTSGFRREKPVFHAFVTRAAEAEVPAARNAAFVLDWRTTHDLAPGAFQPTGHALDMMVEGDGWLAVGAPDGPAYSRAGEARVDADGRIVNLSGYPFLDEGGQPITISPEDAGRLHIAGDGTVSGANGVLGRIAVTRFDAAGMLTPRGDGLMNGAGGRVLPAEETRLRSGGVEGSNVQPVVETTAMIDILRSYQMSARIADSMDDMRKQAIERLGRIG